MEIDLLMCNSLIMKSGYYDFNDNTCIVSLQITLMV